MCFDTDSHPPIPPLAGGAVDGKRIELTASDGTRFAAFKALPSAPNAAGMLILPDVRGLYTFYEELALRFAEAGVTALSIDYFGRTFGPQVRPAEFDHQPHIAQVAWDGLSADIRAGRDDLAAAPGVRALFSVGFCFGGRLSFLLASQPGFDMAGVIGFYGWPLGQSRGVPAPIDEIGKVKAPILGLFGGADQGVTPAIVDSYRAALEAGGVENEEIVVYPGAPHSFFDRKASEFADASADSWRRVLDFVSEHTPAA